MFAVEDAERAALDCVENIGATFSEIYPIADVFVAFNTPSIIKLTPGPAGVGSAVTLLKILIVCQLVSAAISLTVSFCDPPLLDVLSLKYELL